jgi:hypothetical protein
MVADRLGRVVQPNRTEWWCMWCGAKSEIQEPIHCDAFLILLNFNKIIKKLLHLVCCQNLTTI